MVGGSQPGGVGHVVAGVIDAKRLIAEAYDDASDGFGATAERLIYRHLVGPLHAALRQVRGRILDAASGTGTLARLLPGVVALDLSAGQLRHNPAAWRVQGDAERLPFRSDAFAVAACAFGVNHFPDPATAVAEMARVAPLVALLTWARPETPYAPKQAVLEIIERHAGSARSQVGWLVDRFAATVGSPQALGRLLASAGLHGAACLVTVEVPWPGAAAFVDYRLSLPGTAGLTDWDGTRRDAIAAIEALPAAQLRWRPRLVLAVGTRKMQSAAGAGAAACSATSAERGGTTR